MKKTTKPMFGWFSFRYPSLLEQQLDRDMAILSAQIEEVKSEIEEEDDTIQKLQGAMWLACQNSRDQVLHRTLKSSDLSLPIRFQKHQGTCSHQKGYDTTLWQNQILTISCVRSLLQWYAKTTNAFLKQLLLRQILIIFSHPLTFLHHFPLMRVYIQSKLRTLWSAFIPRTPLTLSEWEDLVKQIR